MRRFSEERAIMLRRVRYAADMLNRPGQPLGRYRKRAPGAGCPPSDHCSCCEAERSWHRSESRRARYAARAVIASALLALSGCVSLPDADSQLRITEGVAGSSLLRAAELAGHTCIVSVVGLLPDRLVAEYAGERCFVRLDPEPPPTGFPFGE